MEVIADQEEWLVGRTGDGVGEAVGNVAFAETVMSWRCADDHTRLCGPHNRQRVGSFGPS